MSKDIYIILMNWLKKYNINEISYDLFSKFEISEINYNKLLEKLNISVNFSLYQVDDFIKNNDMVIENDTIRMYKKGKIEMYKIVHENSLKVHPFVIL